MCVILYAPPKHDIKEEYLVNAFINNPDGAGIMHYNKQGQVIYQKGFMDIDSMLNYWRKTDGEFPRAVHCRIATSGVINKENCHPFPINYDLEAMKCEMAVSNIGCLMHNGVLDDYTPKEGMKSKYSDSMIFNKCVIAPLVLGGCIDNDGVKELLNNLSSRFLLFLPNFKVLMFGNWEVSQDGFMASNYSFQYKKDYGRYYGLIDDDEVDDWDVYSVNDYGFSVSGILPRVQYTIQSKDGFDMIDDFVDDYGDYMIDTNEPYCTYINYDGGIMEFLVDIYPDTDFERFLNTNKYTIVYKEIITEEATNK